MKKATLYIALIILIASRAFAQQDAKAKTILNQVSAKFKTFNTVKSDFSFTLDNPQAGAKQTQAGTLITNAKTGKFHVTMLEPGSKTDIEQEIISDGKTQWTYLKKDKEVQVNSAAKADEEMNPSQLFTFYQRGYKYVYTGDQKLNGKACAVIDLSPEDANKAFFKIRLLVDKAKSQLYSATMFDKGGNKYTYTLNTITPNAKVADDAFTFDKKAHPGVEVVDLR